MTSGGHLFASVALEKVRTCVLKQRAGALANLEREKLKQVPV